MNFFNVIDVDVLSFHGRLNRKKYFILSFVFSMMYRSLDKLTTPVIETILPNTELWGFFILLFFSLSFYLFFFYLSLTLAAKRFHDLGKSAWWLVLFIPDFLLTVYFSLTDMSYHEFPVLLIYPVLLKGYLIFFKGVQGPNQYGDDLLGK